MPELHFSEPVKFRTEPGDRRLSSVQQALDWIEREAPVEMRRTLEQARVLLVVACGSARRIDIEAARQVLLVALRELKLKPE